MASRSRCVVVLSSVGVTLAFEGCFEQVGTCRLRIAANDNQAHHATREQMRIGIMLDWWEGELARLMRTRTSGQQWRREHLEAQAFVLRFRLKMADASRLAQIKHEPG